MGEANTANTIDELKTISTSCLNRRIARKLHSFRCQEAPFLACYTIGGVIALAPTSLLRDMMGWLPMTCRMHPVGEHAEHLQDSTKLDLKG